MTLLETACVPTSGPPLPGETPDDQLRAAFIAQLVAMAMGVGAREIAAPSRKAAPAALARQVAMYLAHTALGWPTARVGRAFARHTTTAAYACRRVEDLRDDPALDRMLSACEASIRAAPAPAWSGAAADAGAAA